MTTPNSPSKVTSPTAQPTAPLKAAVVSPVKAASPLKAAAPHSAAPHSPVKVTAPHSPLKPTSPVKPTAPASPAKVASPVKVATPASPTKPSASAVKQAVIPSKREVEEEEEEGILKPGFNSIDDGTLKSTKTPEQSSLPSPKQKKPKKQKKEESDFEDENDDDEDLEGGLDDDVKFLEPTNIIEGGRRTRGKRIDYSKLLEAEDTEDSE